LADAQLLAAPARHHRRKAAHFSRCLEIAKRMGPAQVPLPRHALGNGVFRHSRPVIAPHFRVPGMRRWRHCPRRGELTSVKEGSAPLLYLAIMSPSHHGTEPVFDVTGVTKVYTSGEVEVRALAGIDLQLFAGEIAVLLGPSGSGKSTLLNIIGGLDRATSGSVLFNGRDLTDFSDRQLTRFRRDHIGFVFQFYNLIPSLTAWENVSLVTEVARDPMTPDEALAMVNLTDRMSHFPAQLSGGEQQRVAIARAIAKRPEVLLCDEPTGALDSKTGVIVLEALTRINTEFGTTTAIITHNAGIQQIAHRVFQFLDGRIASMHVNEARIAATEVEW
jgi:putative ABC transport system ATP-binding protein